MLLAVSFSWLFLTFVCAQHETNKLLAEYSDQIIASPESFLPYFKRATLYIQLSRQSLAIIDLQKVTTLNPSFHSAIIQLSKVYLGQCQLDQAVESVLNDSSDQATEIRDQVRNINL